MTDRHDTRLFMIVYSASISLLSIFVFTTAQSCGKPGTNEGPPIVPSVEAEKPMACTRYDAAGQNTIWRCESEDFVCLHSGGELQCTPLWGAQ